MTHTDKVLNRLVLNARQIATDTNNTEKALDYLFDAIKGEFQIYLWGLGTKADYEYFRDYLEKEMRKYF